MREFPPRVEQSEREHFRCGHTFKREDPAAIAPWWTVNQSLAWIATRIPSYVEYIGNLETDEPREHRPYIVHAICESQVAESDEGHAFMEARRAGWPAGTFLAHAGRALLGQILAGEVRPMTRENGQGRQMRAEEFAGVGGQKTGSDWLDLTPHPVFSSDEVMKAFPIEAESSAVEVTAETPAEMPAWLNPYQLVAWVQYRDLHVVAKASDWNGLAAQHSYCAQPMKGSRVDLELALQEGRLIAQGYPKNGDTFAPIPAVEWSRIDVTRMVEESGAANVKKLALRFVYGASPLTAEIGDVQELARYDSVDVSLGAEDAESGKILKDCHASSSR